ncbi:phage Gp37/Gp68 family protein [Fibrella sp. ES10-3-2-2]|nr:hypothetical protein A6C57_00080 [Fibrella sp. ES10-3-2-2]
MATSSIEWTQQTWNPTTGCTKISAGCRDCYAEIMHRRLRAMGQAKYAQPFTEVVTHPEELKRTFGKKPTIVFVNSMSDLFHEDIPLEFIQQAFAAMIAQPQHIFQVLTKRPDRAYQFSSQLIWPDNIWLGTSVEDDRVLERITFLQETGAKVKFLSIEPLIGPLSVEHIFGVDWVIVGGESSRRARPLKHEWVEAIRLQCEKQGIAFFFKQWGGKNKKAAGRLLNGRTYDEMPIFLNNIA